jgi:uridine phosphorylase
VSAEESLVTPRHYLSYLREQGVPAQALTVAPLVLIGWSGLSLRLARMAGACRRRSWPYDGEWPYYEAGDLGIVRMPTGGPAAAFLIDQLVAAGARRLVTAGIAGSLLPRASAGTIVLAGEAIAGDGTSRHYSRSEGEAVPASPELTGAVAGALAAAGAEPLVGTTWTTDAPFREVPAALAAARGRGALVVEMEAAAIYALATHRRVDACSLLVVTDEVWDRWHPRFGTPAVHQAFDTVCRALAGMSSSSPARTFATAST